MYLCTYFWLCWVFVAARRLSPVSVSGGYSLLRCVGFSLQWPLLLWSMGSRHAAQQLWLVGSVVVVNRPSCSEACGIFPDQGSNPCPLHWQADSQPLRHWGSPLLANFKVCNTVLLTTSNTLSSICKSLEFIHLA